MTEPTIDPTRTVEAVWRIEGAHIVAALARWVGDVGVAEDLAHEAVAEALAQWPGTGVPRNAAAWLTTVAKRRAVDRWRREERLADRYRLLAQEVEEGRFEEQVEGWQPIDDDVLRLVFIACHPVLSREAQVALTLRVVAGLSTEEVARLFLVPVPTVQQRIVRAKRTLAAAKVPFEAPEPAQWAERLTAVLGVVYLVFTEGYAATSGDRLVRPELALEALRLGRVLAGLVPREPEVHALVALMELQASRFATRTRADGTPVLLADQDRRRWDHGAIGRGREALARADRLAEVVRRGRGPYALQAAIAECHAVAPDVAGTDWEQVVALYEALRRVAPSPVVELNRAVAVSMAQGPLKGLAIVEELAATGALGGSHLLPSVRGELLARLGRAEAARKELLAAAGLVTNERQRQVLLDKAAGLAAVSPGACPPRTSVTAPRVPDTLPEGP